MYIAPYHTPLASGGSVVSTVEFTSSCDVLALKRTTTSLTSHCDKFCPCNASSMIDAGMLTKVSPSISLAVNRVEDTFQEEALIEGAMATTTSEQEDNISTLFNK